MKPGICNSRLHLKQIHNVFRQAIHMLQEQGLVFQKTMSSDEVYYMSLSARRTLEIHPEKSLSGNSVVIRNRTTM